MENKIEEQHGIECDNCGWSDETPLTTKELETYLNKPCPKCGTILIDKEELLEYSKFMAAIHVCENMSDNQTEAFFKELN